MSAFLRVKKEVKKVVRELKLVNDKKNEFSLMDIEKTCLLTDPTRTRLFLQFFIHKNNKYFYFRL